MVDSLEIIADCLLPGVCMFCAFRPIYQVRVYRTIGPLNGCQYLSLSPSLSLSLSTSGIASVA